MIRNMLACLFTFLLIGCDHGSAPSEQTLSAEAEAAGEEPHESESVQAEKMVLPEPTGPLRGWRWRIQLH